MISINDDDIMCVLFVLNSAKQQLDLTSSEWLRVTSHWVGCERVRWLIEDIFRTMIVETEDLQMKQIYFETESICWLIKTFYFWKIVTFQRKNDFYFLFLQRSKMFRCLRQ